MEEDRKDDGYDEDGFLDLTGSGKLKKKILVPGNEDRARAVQGMVAKCKLQSKPKQI